MQSAENFTKDVAGVISFYHKNIFNQVVSGFANSGIIARDTSYIT